MDMVELTDEELEKLSDGVIHRMAARRWEVPDKGGNIVATVGSRSAAVAKAKELGLPAGEVDWYKYWDMRDLAENPNRYDED